MSKEGIFWVKPDAKECDFERTPPYPSYNAMAVMVDSFKSQYVNVSMAKAFFERYYAATDEILKIHNGNNARIKELYDENTRLKSELNKWKTQQGKGRRPSKKLFDKDEEIKMMKETGISNRQIAKLLDVSEGSIRRRVNLLFS